jgi:hypothetical protein
MEVCAALVADAESFELVQPGEEGGQQLIASGRAVVEHAPI